LPPPGWQDITAGQLLGVTGGKMLHFEFYIGVAKVAAIAFSFGCLICLLYAYVEQLLPNILLTRAVVTYEGPRKKIGTQLIIIGAIGLVAFLVMWAKAIAPSALPFVLIISGVIFDVGAVMFITSEKKVMHATS
jgi:hypothetical protein